MKPATYQDVRKHLMWCGIHLESQLELPKRESVKFYAIINPLIVIYRYSEALNQTLGKRIKVFDMNHDGHRSHPLGTELDFDLPPIHQAKTQVNMASDLLRIRKALSGHLDAFRIGFYFDTFEKAYNMPSNKTYEGFLDNYKKVGVSMHLGVRYRWQCDAYKGAPPSGNYDKFSLWGSNGGHEKHKNKWINRILSWNIGFIKDRTDLVAKKILHDFKTMEWWRPDT